MTEKRRIKKPKLPWWESGPRNEHSFVFRHAEKHYLVWTCTKCGANFKLEEGRKPEDSLFRNDIEEDCSEEIAVRVMES